MSNKLPFCAVCGKNQNQVEKLIKGPKGCICDECILVAFDVLAEGYGIPALKLAEQFYQDDE